MDTFFLYQPAAPLHMHWLFIAKASVTTTGTLLPKAPKVAPEASSLSVPS